jgi:uncharacterized repeat protein (TIGR01451 family)
MNAIRYWLLGGVALVSLSAAVLGQAQLPPVKTIPSGDVPTNLPPITPVIPGVPPPLTELPPIPPPAAVGMPQPRPLPLLGTTSPATDAKPAISPLEVPAPLPPEQMVKPDAVAPLPIKEPGQTADMRLGRQEPAVCIEWVGPPMTRVNHPMTCQLLVRNTCATAVHNVVVRHRPSQGVTCRASNPQPSVDQGELVWSLGTLAAGQVRHIDLQLVVQVKGPLTCNATVTFSGAVAHQVQVNEPKLMVKMKVSEKVAAGEPVTFLFAVSNPGDGVADGVKLKAILPDGIEHQRGPTIEAELGTLAPREIRMLQMIGTARGSGPQKCVIVATADGGLRSSDEAMVEIATARLELAVAGPKLRYIDRKATYVMKVTNPGDATAANVVVHGVVPAGFKYHAATAGGMFDQATRAASWVIGDLQPGQSREVALELVPTAPGEHKLSAQVTSARGLKTEAQTRTTVQGLPTLLIEVVDTDDPVEVGSDTTYEIRVANTGTKMETNVEVICTLPEQVEFRSAKAGANVRHRIDGREVIFEPVAKLAPRADVIYRVQVRGKVAGDVRFRVRVRADGLTEPVVREESTRFYNDDAPAR